MTSPTRPIVHVTARQLQLGTLDGAGHRQLHLMRELRDEVDFAALVDDRLAAPAGLDALGVEVVPLRSPARSTESLWLHGAVGPHVRRHRPDVLDCGFYAVPVRSRVPTVVTIHDLTFEHHRWLPPARRAAFRVQARHAVRAAEVVAVPSAHVAADLTTTYGVEPTRLAVIPNAVDAAFFDGPPAVAPAGVDGPFVLCLDGKPRRRAHLAVDAVRALRTSGHDVALVVVNPTVDRDEPWIVGVPYGDDYPSWLAASSVFVYPTADEGFGMPALEAAATGTPVVCPRVGALPEVMGDGAVWCAPTAGAIAASLAGLFEEEDARRAAGDRARRRAEAAPTWSDAAAALLDVYRTLARGR